MPLRQAARKKFVYRRLHQGENVTPDIPALEVSTPARTPGIEADVLVPVLQGVFTGLLVGAALAAIFTRLTDVTFLDAATVTVPVAIAGAWLWRLDIITRTLHTLETYAGVDLDGGGAVGPKDSGHVALRDPGKAREAVSKTTAERERQIKLADLVHFVNQAATVGASEKAMNVSPGDRERYCEMRDLLISLGIGAWKDAERPRLGWQLQVTPTEAIPLLRQHVMELT